MFISRRRRTNFETPRAPSVPGEWQTTDKLRFMPPSLVNPLTYGTDASASRPGDGFGGYIGRSGSAAALTIDPRQDVLILDSSFSGTTASRSTNFQLNDAYNVWIVGVDCSGGRNYPNHPWGSATLLGCRSDHSTGSDQTLEQDMIFCSGGRSREAYPSKFTGKALSTIGNTGGVVTLTLAATYASTPVIGEQLKLEGSSDANYDRTWVVQSVTSSTVFTVTDLANAALPSSGSSASGGTTYQLRPQRPSFYILRCAGKTIVGTNDAHYWDKSGGAMTDSPTSVTVWDNWAHIASVTRFSSTRYDFVLQAPPAWVTGTAYTKITSRVTNAGNIYEALTSGTSGATAPTGTGSSISDGAVTWRYLSASSTPLPQGTLATGASVCLGGTTFGGSIRPNKDFNFVYTVSASPAPTATTFSATVESGTSGLLTPYQPAISSVTTTVGTGLNGRVWSKTGTGSHADGAQFDDTSLCSNWYVDQLTVEGTYQSVITGRGVADAGACSLNRINWRWVTRDPQDASTNGLSNIIGSTWGYLPSNYMRPTSEYNYIYVPTRYGIDLATWGVLPGPASTYGGVSIAPITHSGPPAYVNYPAQAHITGIVTNSDPPITAYFPDRGDGYANFATFANLGPNFTFPSTQVQKAALFGDYPAATGPTTTTFFDLTAAQAEITGNIQATEAASRGQSLAWLSLSGMSAGNIIQCYFDTGQPGGGNANGKFRLVGKNLVRGTDGLAASDGTYTLYFKWQIDGTATTGTFSKSVTVSAAGGTQPTGTPASLDAAAKSANALLASNDIGTAQTVVYKILDSAGASTGRADTALPASGKKYWEWIFRNRSIGNDGVTNSDSVYLGVMQSGSSTASNTGATATSFGWRSNGNLQYLNGTAGLQHWGTGGAGAWNLGDIIGFAYDSTGSLPRLWGSRNGAWIATDFGVWAATTAYAVGQQVSNGTSPVKIYQCITAGTSAGSGGPTTTAADITDGTVHWTYISATYTTPDPASGIGGYALTSATWYPSYTVRIGKDHGAWVAATQYVRNAYRTNDSNKLYRCTLAAGVTGTSAGSGGPTGTGTGIVDGTVTWDYVSAYVATPPYLPRNGDVLEVNFRGPTWFYLPPTGFGAV